MNQREKIKQAVKELTKWYKENLPTITEQRFVVKRFEILHPFVISTIVINKKFYDEIISKHKDDRLYIRKLEISKQAHTLLEKSLFDRFEEPIHHSEIEVFLVFKSDYQGLKIEFKVKKNSSGYFLHYMRIL
jgi:hypothetical protein